MQSMFFIISIAVLAMTFIAMLVTYGSIFIWPYLKHKERMSDQMSEDQIAELNQMSKLADILDQRVNVLERILDDEVPNWRDQHDKAI